MRVAIVMVVGAACALTSGGRELPTAPPPRAKPTAEDWLPKPGPDTGKRTPREGGGVWINIIADPPTAFPDVRAPRTLEEVKDRDKYWAMLDERCPRLNGAIVLKIEANDGPLQKLLKARLHQGTIEFRHFQSMERGPIVRSFPNDKDRERLLDMQSAATELWANRPNELVPWLEELLVASKELERFMRSRVSVGMMSPIDLHATTRVRLKIEAELWKAKNAK